MAFPVALGPISKWGASIRRKAPEKIVFVVPLYFLTLKAQLFVLVSAIVMVNTVWSVSSLLFFYSRCPPCPSICKSVVLLPVPYGVGATGLSLPSLITWTLTLTVTLTVTQYIKISLYCWRCSHSQNNFMATR